MRCFGGGTFWGGRFVGWVRFPFCRLSTF